MKKTIAKIPLKTLSGVPLPMEPTRTMSLSDIEELLRKDRELARDDRPTARPTLEFLAVVDGTRRAPE